MRRKHARINCLICKAEGSQCKLFFLFEYKNFDFTLNQEMIVHRLRSANGLKMDFMFKLLQFSSHQLSATTIESKVIFLLVICLLNLGDATPFTITGRYCKQNVSIQYQEPVMHTTQIEESSAGIVSNAVTSPLSSSSSSTKVDNITHTTNNNKNLTYVTYETRIRWQTTTVCCPGYRTLFLGFCEPICENKCPPFSYCASPNNCQCLTGYEEHSDNNKEEKLLDCQPICVSGCPRHSQCVARNRCICRDGYKDTSNFLMPMKCEHIRCSALDQRYDTEQRRCVKIDISMEELMKKVAARLTKGLTDYALAEGEDGDEDEEEGEEKRKKSNL